VLKVVDNDPAYFTLYPLPPMNKGAVSVPIEVSTAKAPDKQVLVAVSIKEAIAGITLSKNILRFSRDVN
jgi:hypothetical protein